MQNLTERLLSALDKEYNVINMPVVVEIIGILEQTTITKETLESTRLGKHINELRRKTSDKIVAKRAKDLVRKWRDLIALDSGASGPAGGNGIRTPLNKGHLSPGLPARLSQPASPASRVSSLSPETPAVSPRLHGYSPAQQAASSNLDNGMAAAPRGRGRPPKAQTPTSPHPPRPRGRPPKNKHKREASDLLPKSSPANKRLRKASSETEMDEHPRLNGCSPHPQVPRTHKVKTTRELLQSIQQESSLELLRSKTLSSLGVVKTPEKVTPVVTPPSLPQISPKKEIKSPMVTVKRRPSPVPTPPSPTGSDVDVEIISGNESTPIKPSTPPPARPETVEEILASLPPLRTDEIRWSDEEDDYVPESHEVTEEDVRRLQETHIEGFNGNTSEGACCPDPPEAAPHGLKVPLSAEYGSAPRTCPSDCPFREWHQAFSRTSYNGDLLHILPYVIVD